MSQDNLQIIPQADLIAIDALFRRIAERGRRVRSQAQINSVPEQNNSPSTGKVIKDTNKGQAQNGK